jgi:hypothetical protein
MQLSARNQLKGRVVIRPAGPTRPRIHIDTGGRVIVPGERPSDEALVFVRASDATVAK